MTLTRLLLTTVFVFLGCSDESPQPAPPIVPTSTPPDMSIAAGTPADMAMTAPAPTLVVVSMSASAFVPANVTITRGSTVRWNNPSGIPHTVTSGAGSTAANVGAMFDRQTNPNDVFEFTFAQPGTFPYFCRFHEAMGMRGTVTVAP